ncbi:hypothetical protein BBP00_00004266 [Phytophthora kernoviae]|nr:hypothetical protein BBP00_00004266 [Phytophthora kernoviae]
MTDGIICGVCRAPVDARGLIASRKEAKRQDFEKKESRFVQSGCYINPFAPNPKDTSLVTSAMQAYFNEALRLVRPYDPYALCKLETAHTMLVRRSGPGVAVLRMLTQEYTRFVYIKHTRAVEKARAQKRKRAEHEAQEHHERERKRISLEAEQALKSQMLAMRNKQRQHLKATSSKQTT